MTLRSYTYAPVVRPPQTFTPGKPTTLAQIVVGNVKVSLAAQTPHLLLATNGPTGSLDISVVNTGQKIGRAQIAAQCFSTTIPACSMTDKELVSASMLGQAIGLSEAASMARARAEMCTPIGNETNVESYKLTHLQQALLAFAVELDKHSAAYRKAADKVKPSTVNNG